MSSTSNKTKKISNDNDFNLQTDEDVFEEIFPKVPLGLIMSYRKEDGITYISGFVNIAASHNGNIRIGDQLVSINGIYVDKLKGKDIHKIINASSWPITLSFRRIKSNNNTNNNNQDYNDRNLKYVEELNMENSNIDIINNGKEIFNTIYQFNNNCKYINQTILNKNQSIDNLNVFKIIDCKQSLSSINHRIIELNKRIENLEIKI